MHTLSRQKKRSETEAEWKSLIPHLITNMQRCWLCWLATDKLGNEIHGSFRIVPSCINSARPSWIRRTWSSLTLCGQFSLDQAKDLGWTMLVKTTHGPMNEGCWRNQSFCSVCSNDFSDSVVLETLVTVNYSKLRPRYWLTRPNL